jgi:ankyrin repeat protein
MSKPTQEDNEDLILSARFGELEEVTAFADKFGWDAVAAAKDERGNTALHMACGNGHLGKFQGRCFGVLWAFEREGWRLGGRAW